MRKKQKFIMAAFIAALFSEATRFVWLNYTYFLSFFLFGESTKIIQYGGYSIKFCSINLKVNYIKKNLYNLIY